MRQGGVVNFYSGGVTVAVPRAHVLPFLADLGYWP
jgi:hypothetical protein